MSESAEDCRSCSQTSTETKGLRTMADDEEDVPEIQVKREHWSSGLDFILTCVGCAVGLGNIWRFPYLCYKNGGGAFLIPYLVCMLGGGVPVFLLEVALGQFMSVGSLRAWSVVPALQGIGGASYVILFLANIYYIVVLSWAFTFLWQSFTSVLPWSTCDNSWNTDSCFNFDEWTNRTIGCPTVGNSSDLPEMDNCSLALSSNDKRTDPAVEFWERQILQISGGITEPGYVVWRLAMSLVAVWIIVYFCVWRGIKWSGKVVYFTATVPYLIITVLLIRGVSLDGAVDGLVFYLRPDFSRLADAGVWVDGGTQVFFSYTIAIGAMISLGSYNRFRNNFYKDVMIISCINSGTSFYSGFAVFSVLGFMAKQQNVSISEVAESGPGLVFIAYPRAITQMPFPPIWAVLFFLMILMVGLDSQFVCVESLLTPVMDAFPRYQSGTRARMLLTACYCLFCCLIALTMITQGGMYVFQLFDYYSASGLVLLWACFFESIAIGWLLGADKFNDMIELMLGERLSPWWSFCWRFLTPLITSGIFIFMLVTFEPLTYNKTYVYPAGATALGVSLGLVSMCCIPLTFLVKMMTAKGSLAQRWRTLTTPILRRDRIPISWKELGYRWAPETQGLQ